MDASKLEQKGSIHIRYNYLNNIDWAKNPNESDEDYKFRQQFDKSNKIIGKDKE